MKIDDKESSRIVKFRLIKVIDKWITCCRVKPYEYRLINLA